MLLPHTSPPTHCLARLYPRCPTITCEGIKPAWPPPAIRIFTARILSSLGGWNAASESRPSLDSEAICWQSSPLLLSLLLSFLLSSSLSGVTSRPLCKQPCHRITSSCTSPGPGLGSSGGDE